MKIYQELFFLAIMAGLFILISGCANAISYHHSERVSLAVEARAADPVSPVQGTLGVRSRTLVVSPGKDNHTVEAPPMVNTEKTQENKDVDAEVTSTDIVKLEVKAVGPTPQKAGGQAEGTSQIKKDPPIKKNGEAASFVSDFNLERDGTFLGRTTIESAFITGAAAKKVPVSTMTAITGLGSGGIDEISEYRRQLLDETYNYLDILTRKGDLQAQQLKNDLDDLGERKPVSADISGNNYYQLGGGNLTDVPGSKFNFEQTFTGALEFIKEIEGNLEILKEVFDDRTVTYNGSVIGEDDMIKLKSDQKRLEQEKKDFFRKIGNDPVINKAVAYINTNL